MKKIIACFTLLSLFLITSAVFSAAQNKKPEWNILIYMDGMDELYPAAIKNITDAMAGYTGDNAQIFIQMHSDSTTLQSYRYHLAPGKLIFDTIVTLDPDPVKNIINSTQWAFNEEPAEYKGLIFWNHAFGILDPTWQKLGMKEKFGWLSEKDERMLLPLTRSGQYKHAQHRGIFLDNIVKTYLNNHQMVLALAGIRQQVLNNNKLEFLGTDTCGMAMLEIAWQVRDYANYFIGAQNCALKDGWPYHEIMAQISSTSHTPIQAINMIINKYATYYQQTGVESYTQAALDLSQIDAIKKNLDQITTILLDIFDKEQLKTMVHNARKKCPIFCVHPTYTDLWTFYDKLAYELPSNNFQKIRVLLQTGKHLIEQAVVAHTAGNLMSQAHGISIYFPYHHVDNSYLKTQFSQDSTWTNFLTKIFVHV